MSSSRSATISLPDTKPAQASTRIFWPSPAGRGSQYDIPISLRAGAHHAYFSGRLSFDDGGSFHIINPTIPYELLFKLAPIIADNLDQPRKKQ
jgi:hypothetical protein